MRRQTRNALVLAALVLAADQWSKWLILNNETLLSATAIKITSFFNIVLVWNHGVSFGMFSRFNRPGFLIIVSLVIEILLWLWLKKARAKSTAYPLGLIMGGAFANIIDRLRFGAVTDFLDFHLGSYHWPVFNLADSAICIGVVLLCAEGMFKPKH